MADINEATQSDNAQKKRKFHGKKKAKKVDNYEPNAPKEILDIKIEALELSEKTYNSLVEGVFQIFAKSIPQTNRLVCILTPRQRIMRLFIYYY